MPATSSPTADFVLTLACPDTRGIVHSVSQWLVERDCNILDSSQFGDAGTGLFTMRIHFRAEGDVVDARGLYSGFGPVATRYRMTWDIWDRGIQPRVLILVSKADHCLHDLLYRVSSGDLEIDVPAIVSNHGDVENLVAAYRIPFHHWPVEPGSGREKEAKLLELINDENIDFVVLARYMQILSPDLCEKLPGRIINIHHSFLPSFKGADSYRQAYERGVKLIGATAHYVTSDLDEGPIIEQEVVRVDHSKSIIQLKAMGKDLEKAVLARAVRYHAQRRVILNGMRTVVFP